MSIQNGFPPYENTDFIERVMYLLLLTSPDFCSWSWLWLYLVCEIKVEIYWVGHLETYSFPEKRQIYLTCGLPFIVLPSSGLESGVIMPNGSANVFLPWGTKPHSKIGGAESKRNLSHNHSLEQRYFPPEYPISEGLGQGEKIRQLLFRQVI